MNNTGAPRPFHPATPQVEPKIIVELRPCSIGFAGISQETRLLYSVLSELPDFQIGGLLNAFHDLILPRSMRKISYDIGESAELPSKAVFKQSRLVWALESEIQGVRSSNKVLKWWRSLEKKDAVPAFLRYLVASRQTTLLPFNSILFDDFVWTRYFHQTLPASDRQRITQTKFYTMRKGWIDAHFGCRDRRTSARIDTTGWDFFFCQVPTPFIVSPGTKIVVRYHDSIPLFLPHTVNGYDLKRFYWGLRASIRNGAFFACTSQPVRDELIRLFPEVEPSSAVIPDIVSDQFYKEGTSTEKLAEILYRRKCPETTPPKARSSRQKGIKEPYVVSVSTLEPRKNYRLLLQAWAVACQRLESPPLLVMVANLGWRNAEDIEELKPLVKAGRVAHLTRVGLHELRALYSGAHAVVCPSRAEGFDLSGVEAMLCETPVIASDISVHRSVYGDAALYFDPYDVDSCANMLVETLSIPKDSGLLASLRDKGTERAKLYTRDAIGPQWADLFYRLAGRGTGTASMPSPVSKRQSPVLSDAELA